MHVVPGMDKLKNRELLSIQTFALLVLFATCSALLLMRAEEVSDCLFEDIDSATTNGTQPLDLIVENTGRA